MTTLDAFRLAVSGLRGNALRTLLSILGLSVGVGAVITVLALSDAGEIRVEQEIEKLGVNKVWIRQKDDSRSVLSMGTAQQLESVVMSPACAATYTITPVRIGNRIITTQAAGFDANLQTVHGIKLIAGRIFTEDEHENAGCVCLVDETLAEYMGSDVLGRRIAVAGRRPVIVGVVKKLSTQTMSGSNGLMILPILTFFDTFGGNVSEITISLQGNQQAEEVASTALMTIGHAEVIRADTLTKEINAAREIVRIFVMILLAVAGICMLTGGIGVMNVLLLSVAERKQEIGLIKALGGSAAQVAGVFLIEACVYAFIGGVAGVIWGKSLIDLAATWIGMNARLDIFVVISVVLCASMLGVVFGAGPAVKAGRLQPIDALQKP